MTTFKKGQRVRIKKGLTEGNHYMHGYSLSLGMLQHTGKVTSIKSIYNASDERYLLKIDNGWYAWTADMLEIIGEVDNYEIF